MIENRKIDTSALAATVFIETAFTPEEVAAALAIESTQGVEEQTRCAFLDDMAAENESQITTQHERVKP